MKDRNTETNTMAETGITPSQEIMEVKVATVCARLQSFITRLRPDQLTWLIYGLPDEDTLFMLEELVL